MSKIKLDCPFCEGKETLVEIDNSGISGDYNTAALFKCTRCPFIGFERVAYVNDYILLDYLKKRKRRMKNDKKTINR